MKSLLYVGVALFAGRQSSFLTIRISARSDRSRSGFLLSAIVSAVLPLCAFKVTLVFLCSFFCMCVFCGFFCVVFLGRRWFFS